MKHSMQTLIQMPLISRVVTVALLTLGSLTDPAKGTTEIACGAIFSSEAIRPEAVYEELKSRDRSSLVIRNENEKDLLIQHLRNLAGQRPILIFTDASARQTSGVVVMMKVLAEIEQRFGIRVRMVVPEDFKNMIAVNYQNLVFALPTGGEVRKFIARENPYAIHIMVEGSVGHKVRHTLLSTGLPFTTAYHTDFPKILSSSVRTPLLKDVVSRMAYKVLQQFHRPSSGIMVPTLTMAKELQMNGLAELELRNWSHGVDIVKFSPHHRDESLFKDLPKPISLFVGRVSPEKNIESFLAMKTRGTKVIVGDGPDLATMKARYPDAVFLGRQPHGDMPKYFASADLFVFPSIGDTFGLVLLEAVASGTPVLAFDYQGPKDAVPDPRVSVLVPYSQSFRQSVSNLEAGFERALQLSRTDARQYAEEHSWETSLLEFLYFLEPIVPGQPLKRRKLCRLCLPK